MASPRQIRFVWSVHARIRELQRVEDGLTLPDLGAFVRLLYLGDIKIENVPEQRWVFLTCRCFVYGQIFRAPDYDVFLIRTVIARPHLLWQAPRRVALYHLETINEQGEEGNEAYTWKGYTYHLHDHNTAA